MYSRASGVIPRRIKGKGQVIFRQVVELCSFRLLAGQQPLRLSRDPHLQVSEHLQQEGEAAEGGGRNTEAATGLCNTIPRLFNLAKRYLVFIFVFII